MTDEKIFKTTCNGIGRIEGTDQYKILVDPENMSLAKAQEIISTADETGQLTLRYG